MFSLQCFCYFLPPVIVVKGKVGDFYSEGVVCYFLPPIIVVESKVGKGVDGLVVPQLQQLHRQVAINQQFTIDESNMHSAFVYKQKENTVFGGLRSQ